MLISKCLAYFKGIDTETFIVLSEVAFLMYICQPPQDHEFLFQYSDSTYNFNSTNIHIYSAVSPPKFSEVNYRHHETEKLCAALYSAI